MRPYTFYQKQLDFSPLEKEFAQLAGPDFKESIKAIAFDYVVIIAAITAFIFLPTPLDWLCYPLIVFIIGARQHGLLILMHDGSHGNLHPNPKINEFISDIFCAFPHFVSTEGYRVDHLKHHKYVGSDNDPNWATKRDLPDWHFPKTKQETISVLIKDLLGNGFLRIVYFMQRYFKNQTNLNGEMAKPSAKVPKKNKRQKLTAVFFYLGIFILLTLTHQWHLFIYLWLIPFLTVLPMLLRLRQLNEHYGLERQHDFNMSRNYQCRWFEKFLFAPHNVHYHLDHHLFMSVPFYQLPKLNQILKKHPDFNAIAHESTGVLSNHPKSVLCELALQKS